MARKRTVEIDWAGPHGTAWGTVNSCLCTVTLAWGTHFLATRVWHLPGWNIVLGGIFACALAVIIVLVRAALRASRQPGATTMYQLFCVTGALTWATYMAAHHSWPWRWWLARVAALAAAAIVAGLLAGLASSERPEQESGDTARGPEPDDPRQVTLDTLAEQWEERLNRLCDGDPANDNGWKVPGIEKWERGNGYTVEAIAPKGGATWQAVERAKSVLYGDLDLVYGGALVVSMGTSQRVALIEVTTEDILAGDYAYPEDRPVHSIRDDLNVGVRDDGSPIGPNLLQKCMFLAGEAGSGKTNAGHCLTAEIVTTNDCLLWGWELTGGGLWAAWMDPWHKGEIEVPPFDWCAFDAKELRLMTRAALRVGYTRKPGYRQAMIDADDDKVPVSSRLPEIIIIGDEIAKVTGAPSEHPDIYENLRLGAFELRAAAIREIYLGLRGTDDIISSGIQSQCQVKGVMKVATKNEANWVVGNYGFGPEDTPYPGCGGLSLSSGEPLTRMKWYRMKPSTIRRIAKLAELRRPTLDRISLLAANGRHPDGTPMPNLMPGELDCYDSRWDRYMAHYETGFRATAEAAPVAGVSLPGPEALAGTMPAPALSPAEAMAEMDNAMAALDAAVAQKNAERMDDDGFELDPESAAVFAEMARMAEEGFGDDWQEDDPHRPESAPHPGDEEVLLAVLKEAGPAGMGPKDLLSEMASWTVVIHRDTLHKRLKALREQGKVHQPRFGRWAFGPKP